MLKRMMLYEQHLKRQKEAYAESSDSMLTVENFRLIKMHKVSYLNYFVMIQT